MKRILIMILPLMLLSALVYAEPTRFGSDNGVWVGGQAQQGSLTVGASQLGVFDGTFNPPIVYLAPEAASVTAYDTVSISTATLITTQSGTTTTVVSTDFTDVITPRNLVFQANFAGDASTMTVTATALVTGWDMRGSTITESISFSTTTGTGYKAFSHVSKVQYVVTAIKSGSSGSTLLMYMGCGGKLGIPADISTSSEVIKVIENKAVITSGTWDYSYDTYTPASATNGTLNYVIYLKPLLR